MLYGKNKSLPREVRKIWYSCSIFSSW